MYSHCKHEDSHDEFLKSDDALFHYTRSSTTLEYILDSKLFKFSLLNNTNDPYEYKEKIFMATGWGWDECVEKNINLAKEHINNIIKKQVVFSSFCCNSSKNGNPTYGYSRPRMWSQYGEGHKGVCLVFSKTDISNTLEHDYGSESYVIFQDSMKYKDNLINGSRHHCLCADKDTFEIDTPYNYACKHIEAYYQDMFFFKQMDYKDEHEYRIILLTKGDRALEENGIYINIESSLKGIILGDRFPKVYYSLVKDICKNLKIKLKYFHYEAGEFLLLDKP